jgi:hypothetical protein
MTNEEAPPFERAGGEVGEVGSGGRKPWQRGDSHSEIGPTPGSLEALPDDAVLEVRHPGDGMFG